MPRAVSSPQLAGIDIEEGVAAEMLGDRHRARASPLAVARDEQMLRPDADGGGAVPSWPAAPVTKFIFGEPMKPATKRLAGWS